MSDKDALIAAERATGEPAPSVSAMCACLEVSRSGFYDWQRAEPLPRQLRRAQVTQHMHAAFDTYGVRRVHAILTGSTDPEVAPAPINLVGSIMREEGLAACQPRALHGHHPARPRHRPDPRPRPPSLSPPTRPE